MDGSDRSAYSGSGTREPDSTALTRRVAPHTVVSPEHGSLVVDDRALLSREPLALEKGAVVVAGEETCFLAVRAVSDGETRRRSLAAGAALALLSEWKCHPIEERWVDCCEHVGLILGGVGSTRNQPHPVALDDPCVVSGPEDVCAGALGEVHEGVEAESTVAPHAGVWRQALRVAVDERLHDGRPKCVAEIERDVREPESMTGLPRCDHRVR